MVMEFQIVALVVIFVDGMQSCQKHDGDGDNGDFQNYLCLT
jgi:hypothetical protein